MIERILHREVRNRGNYISQTKKPVTPKRPFAGAYILYSF